MRKLTLDLDALAVESFETTAPDENDGTVHGNQLTRTCYETCGTCRTCNTCRRTFRCGYTACVEEQTCAYTCGRTCHNACRFGGATVIALWGTCQYTCQKLTCAEYTCHEDTCVNTCTWVGWWCGMDP